MSHPLAIEHEAVYPHSPERVWRALVDPTELAAWLMPNDFAPEVGREFKLETGAAEIGTIQAEVLEIDEPRLAALPVVGRVRRHRGDVRAHPRGRRHAPARAPRRLERAACRPSAPGSTTAGSRSSTRTSPVSSAPSTERTTPMDFTTPPIVSADEWDAARADAPREGEGGDAGARRARGRASAHAVARGRQGLLASTRRTARRTSSTCSTVARSSSCTARSSSPACTAGPTTRASAARWSPTRSRTPRTSTRATRRSCSRRAHRRPTSSASRRAWAGSTSPGSRCSTTSTRTSASTSGTAPTRSSATATRCTAPTSSTPAATSRWATPGTTSTSPRSVVRRSGRTRPRATRRTRRTRGGSGTTSPGRGTPPRRRAARDREGVRPRARAGRRVPVAHIAGVPVEELGQPVLIALLLSGTWLSTRLRGAEASPS